MTKERAAGVVVWGLAFAATLASGACSYASDTLFSGAVLADGGGVLPKNCQNALADEGESDVDCGGGGCGPCAVGKHCSDAKQCGSLSCAGNDPSGATCQAPSFTDGVKNGSETGLDCGGSVSAPKCPPGQACRTPDDCVDAVCKNAECTTPGATDGVKNGSETDIDCGGAQAPRCENGKTCASGADCATSACSPSLLVCAPVTAIDGVKNGGETDVDCGGAEPGVPRCAPGKACGGVSDCVSRVCAGNLCQPPTGSDGVQNGDESDLDCGGILTGAPRCQPGKLCAGNPDCSLGCTYKKVCAESRTCIREHGGDTCGPGEGPAQHESCCALGSAYAAGGGNVALEKYLVTAGRMRALIETLDGDLAGWVSANRPAGFDSAWIAQLPTNKFDAEQGVGPYGVSTRAGCSFADTYRTSARTYDTDSDLLGSDGQVDRGVEVGRDLLDEKPLNCVTFEMAAALCAFDGRQVASAVALNTAISPDGRAAPWGGAPSMGSSPASLTSGLYSAYRNAGASGTFTYVMPPNAVTENSRGIPAPGRMANSVGPYGNYDLFAPMLHWVGKGLIDWTYSWEGHGRPDGSAAPFGNEAYHAIGFRCMKVL